MASRIGIHEAPGWTRLLAGKLRQAAERGVLSAGQRTVAHIQTVVIPAQERPPVDRGAYRAAWRAEQLRPGSVLVTNTLPYAAVVEYGARAENVKVGRKMIEALAGWAKRKGLVRSGESAASVAWAIANAMRKHGIFNRGKGLRVLEQAAREIPRFLEEEIRREIDRLK